MCFLTGLYNLPFLILTSLVEAYLFLVAARLIISTAPSTRKSQFYHQLRLLTDALPNAVQRTLSKWTKAVVPSWVSWLTVILWACMARQLLVTVAMTQIP